MNQKYTIEIKQQAVNRYLSGESVYNIAAGIGVPRSTLYAWLKHHSEEQSNGKKQVTLQNFRLLQKKVKRLEGIVEILQRVECSVHDPLDRKLYALESLYGQYSVHMLCEALGVPRGTFYNHMFRSKRDHTWYAKRREEFRLKIQQIYDDNRQIFGAEKITAIMKEDGLHVNVEFVRKLMRDIGLISIRQEAKNPYDKERRCYKNYLNQQFRSIRPNQVWVSDITYFRYNNKDYCICAILDLFARVVVGYRIGITNSTQLVKSPFKSAYESRRPGIDLIFHTDCGGN